MDYDLIVVKTLERVYKNYYYIIRGEIKMDLKVLEVQKWLNLTYGNHPDFPAVTEDGLTGNSTIKALIRGLQIEAGVKVDGVLGSGL